MATGCSAPVAEDAWRIVLQRTLGDTAVEGKDYFVPCQDALKRARTINASIDEQMVGEALAKADVIDQLGCDETSLNGVSEQASFAKVRASAPSPCLASLALPAASLPPPPTASPTPPLTPSLPLLAGRWAPAAHARRSGFEDGHGDGSLRAGDPRPRSAAGSHLRPHSPS
jgi:hypothetical protein